MIRSSFYFGLPDAALVQQLLFLQQRRTKIRHLLTSLTVTFEPFVSALVSSLKQMSSLHQKSFKFRLALRYLLAHSIKITGNDR